MIDKRYREYLQSPEWERLRKATLCRASYKCERCAATDKRLEVHHRHYRTLYAERFEDLECLCQECHEKAHQVTATQALAEVSL